jgi:hypothetical protein
VREHDKMCNYSPGLCICTCGADAYNQGYRQALDDAARAMNPMLRSMISRGAAVRVIRALGGGKDKP